jgi:uncharacterized protein YkwD
MAVKRAFRPTALDELERLEARLVMSHFGVTHLIAPILHGNGHHHGVVHAVKRGHRTVLHKHTGTGPKSQSNPSKPVVVVPIANPPSTTPDQNPPTTTPTIVVPAVTGLMSAQEQTIVDLVNQQRAQSGLASLVVDSRLVVAAQIHSRDMATLGQMEHTLPGAALPTLESRAQYVGYNYSYLGENIAFNYPDGNSVMTAWMNSPGHRANILNVNYTAIGVGISQDAAGEPYYTQEVGKPA